MTSEMLATWASELDLRDAPANVSSFAATLFANAAGVTVGGLDEPATTRAVEAAATLSGRAQACRIVGVGVDASLEQAAFVHGVAAHVLDFDETELATIYHATASIYASVITLGQVRDVDGVEALTAFLVGLEVGIRVAAALGMPHYDRGWHVTGTAGPVAVAAACSRLLRSSPAETATAMAIGATSAGGHRAHFGTDTKSGHVGFAAMRGLHAAILARTGFTASAQGLDGHRGLLQVVGPDGDPEALTRDLGGQWRVLGDRIKPYASGVVTHPAIDAGRELRAMLDGRIGQVERVHLRVHPLVEELTGIRSPSDGLQGKFSAAHCFAVGLVMDRGDPDAFSEAAIHDPAVRRIRDGLTIVADPNVVHMTMDCQARLSDGGERRWRVMACRGSDQRPMTGDEVRDKVVRSLSRRLDHTAASQWYARLSELVDEPSSRGMLLEFDHDLVRSARGTSPARETDPWTS